MTWLRNSASVLIVLLPLASCQTVSPEQLMQTTARTGARTDAQITAEVCRAWTTQEFDSRFDTQLTVDQARELNRRRAAYCDNKEK